ncbi:MAG: acetamidase/formamidase family protein [Chloroflexales bacterium]|nr:acetamidase/formamidase family protein [Chloroflexales bacterium]
MLEPKRATLHGQFSRDLAPALTITSGDVVRCRTLGVSWGLESRRPNWSPRQTFGPRETPRDAGPCLLGPIAIHGAQPEHVLEVHLDAIIPGSYGWTFAGEIGFFNTALNRALGVADGEAHLMRWSLDPIAMVGTNHMGYRVSLRPFLGTLGLCPADEGGISAWPPRRTGGNLDCKELVSGTVLYVPVEVDGALVSLGDWHAAQGDGEASGTAIECPMDQIDLRFILRDDLQLDTIRAKTSTGWVTFGFSETLDDAIVFALLVNVQHSSQELSTCRHQYTTMGAGFARSATRRAVKSLPRRCSIITKLETWSGQPMPAA